MVARLTEKINLSAKGLLAKVKKKFGRVKEPPKGEQGRAKNITITDCLMSALAVFKLKFPSLLQFDKEKEDGPLKVNLENLFGVDNVPCDTYMRERLDEIEPKDVRPAFTSIFSELQRGKVLEKYEFMDGKYLLLSDGTGFFSSKKVHCNNCCKKEHRNGTTTYYHQMMGAAIVHPDHKEVIPICPEPIMNGDGSTKNDCERNASERLLRDFRREHPHLPVIVAEDALASNGPHLKLLVELKMSFITVVKPDGNKALFDWINTYNWDIENQNNWDKNQGAHTFKDENGIIHQFHFANEVPLNDSHSDFKVNFLEYWTFDSEGKQIYHNTWITDTQITTVNCYQIARGGRARWKIENETFNTLKNQGYHFEHNYGHGYKNLSTVLAMLMMLAFLIDQAEQICCGLFQGALKRLDSMKSYLWRHIKRLFETHIIPSWEVLYWAIINTSSRSVPVLDSS